MAVGDWDSLVMSFAGERVVDDIFIVSRSIGVLFYKDHLHVYDTNARVPYAAPRQHVVARIQEGYLEFEDISILALRGPQDGIYAAAWAKSGNAGTNGVIGCSMRNYDEHTNETTGILPSSLAWFNAQILTSYVNSRCYRFSDVVPSIGYKTLNKMMVGHAADR